MKPSLLILNPMSARALDTIATHFTPTYAPDDARRAAAVASHGPAFRAVLTIGSIGLAAAEIDAMPKLELICVLGAGFENVDVAHARARGIVIANGAGTNDDCVADHAMALLLASVRAVPQFDRACRAGVWRTALPVQPNVSRKRLGLVGLGAIGAKIARRAAGFDMPVGYHSRTQRADTAYPWFASVAALAAWCDFLVIAAPGGPATKHLVNAEVLDALGSPLRWSGMKNSPHDMHLRCPALAIVAPRRDRRTRRPPRPKLVGSQSEENENREPKKTVNDGDRKKTDQEENARSDRLKEDKFRPAPTSS